jgi:fatty-acyl-CoA synthase
VNRKGSFLNTFLAVEGRASGTKGKSGGMHGGNSAMTGSTISLKEACWPADRSRPVLEQTIGDVLREAAWRHGSDTALVEGVPGQTRQRWSFDELLAIAERAARALLARFAPGEHVAVWSANSPEWVFIEFGAALAGIVLVTVNPAYLAKEAVHVLAHSRASGALASPAYRGRNLVATLNEIRSDLPFLRHVVSIADWDSFLAEANPDTVLPRVLPKDIAQIQYTSGTTGTPKGARLTHLGLANNARLFAEVIGARPGDVWVNPMPMFHTAGCGLATLGALQAGGAHVLLEAFDPAVLLALLEAERGTIALCVPTMLIRILDHPAMTTRDLGSWRLVTLGGAPVAPELVRRAQLLPGLQVAIGFGQTEASPYITHTVPGDPDPHWISTVGRPLPCTEVKIVHPVTGETCSVDVVGEICARGPGIMAGYFDDEHATSAAIDADGWLHTGDLGSMDATGFCRVQGRLKEMIIRGGENIYPREIEDVLSGHPDVAGVAVLGTQDDEWGEVVVAVVQSRDGHTPSGAELAAFCRQHLASYKVPREWRFVAELPQTASGKIQKFLLREQLVASETAAPAGAPAPLGGIGPLSLTADC